MKPKNLEELKKFIHDKLSCIDTGHLLTETEKFIYEACGYKAVTTAREAEKNSMRIVN